jgi:hypothetical protein
MIGTPLWEIQVAAVAAMQARAPLMAMVEEIRDTEIPEGEPRPHRYIVVSEFPGDVPARTFGRGGRDNLVWFHVWDDGRQADGSTELGNRNPTEIISELFQIFDEKRIALDDWTMLNGSLALVRLARDPNIAYMHGVLQYRVISKAPVAL